MSFDFQNWFLGVLTAIVVGVAGRLLYKSISERLEKRPKLDWFILADFSAPDLRIHNESSELFYSARKQNEEKFTDNVIAELRADLRKSKKAVKLKLRNDGTGRSEAVSILLSQEPNSIVLTPTITTKKTTTSDNKTQIEIAAIDKGSSLDVLLYGISDYEIAGIFHQGIGVERIPLPDLVPKKRPINPWPWLIWGLFFGSLFQHLFENYVGRIDPFETEAETRPADDEKATQ